jgi:acetoacetyl-CoA synthetase
MVQGPKQIVNEPENADATSRGQVIAEGELLWMPSPERVASSAITAYLEWLKRNRGLSFSSYNELWRWSVSSIEEFWASIWERFDVLSDTPYRAVLDGHAMPGARWFDGAKLNYAEHVLRHESAQPDKPALYHASEARPFDMVTWRELGQQVRILATQLRGMGVVPGDRVVSYMPNVPETAVAMLAATAIGAVWSSAAPEFGVKTVLERFRQIEPKVMFVADGYVYGGTTFPRIEEAKQIVGQLASLEHVVWLPIVHTAEANPIEDAAIWHDLMARSEIPIEEFRYERVAHDHPLWILFSSGTTGLPKAIVHGHVGALLELLKLTHLQLDLGPQSVMFFYSTTGWVMWNILLSALLTGAAAVLYDGNPVYPGVDVLWCLAERTGTTLFGTSPTYVKLLEKSGAMPKVKYELSHLESVVLSGSPATPETFDWLYRNVKRDLWINSISGGTELCSALVGGAPILPVHAGEIQGRALGMDVQAWSPEGRELRGEVGELVLTKPCPSMPLCFWNDEGNRRYLETYFDTFPGIWRHGDFVKFNERGGCYIYGRSDSTLNRFGVRIGTAEIYRAVEQVGEIADCLIVCCERPGGEFFMPLFVQTKAGAPVDDALRAKIDRRLREECSPRHVPDQIIEVSEIPYTLSGKKMEIPVRRILMGWPVEKSASREAMKNPEALVFFTRFAELLLQGSVAKGGPG